MSCSPADCLWIIIPQISHGYIQHLSVASIAKNEAWDKPPLKITLKFQKITALKLLYTFRFCFVSFGGTDAHTSPPFIIQPVNLRL